MLKNVPLRVQVIALVAILGLALLAAVAFIFSMTSTARESIVRLNRDRLATLTDNLARRYGSVIGFIAPAQFEDTTLSERSELTSLLSKITREELVDRPGVHAGFYHSLWNRQISKDPFGEGRVESMPYERFLRVQLETTLELRREQWSHNEVGESNFIMVTRPVFARGRLVGSAWTLGDLKDELGQTWPINVTSLLLVSVVLGILIASVFIIRLRNDINSLQTGLETMSHDLSVRLPVSTTELGFVARSINDMAGMIVEQQKEREAMMQVIQQKEKMASLGQLIAGVAHEIRTPISVIKTRVQLWQRPFIRSTKRVRPTDTNSVTPASMSMVVNELDRIERIVRKLLYFSRRRSVESRPTRVDALLDDALNILSAEIRDRKIVVRRDYVEPPITLLGDESELREVFLNLIQNALEAMTNGGQLEVKIFRDPVTFSPQCSVGDSGIGIQPDSAVRVFEPFYTTKHTGTGLGLSIANEIIQAHHGSLTFTTGESGTTFTITFKHESTRTQ